MILLPVTFLTVTIRVDILVLRRYGQSTSLERIAVIVWLVTVVNADQVILVNDLYGLLWLDDLIPTHIQVVENERVLQHARHQLLPAVVRHGVAHVPRMIAPLMLEASVRGVDGIGLKPSIFALFSGLHRLVLLLCFRLHLRLVLAHHVNDLNEVVLIINSLVSVDGR